MVKWKQNIEFTLITAGSLAVDTFFLISGLLLSYGYLKFKSTFRKNNVHFFGAFYFLRFFKCVEQSWYLAVDSQLYLISPIILLNLENRPLKTCMACIAACLISGFYAFIITIKNNYTAFFIEGSRGYYQFIYTAAFARMPPWLIGVVLGYLIFTNQRIRIPKAANLFLWFSCVSLMTYIILIHLVLTRNEYDPLVAAVFNSCVRPAWALGVGMIIFSCVTGHGG
ncbi:hypothetical protein NQ317_007561 [Molorchus minor]|uniref:Acyltransferase 3 domain-containing protein n=1 Tax=Molorchus minor TaxID=1323400 RepID=A0ABQ9K710_9CUCU|nr:hypothetical protein NQ317_007561 [Molorchus minor]